MIANAVRDQVDPDANIIFGTVFDPSLKDTVRVSVIAAVRVALWTSKTPPASRQHDATIVQAAADSKPSLLAKLKQSIAPFW